MRYTAACCDPDDFTKQVRIEGLFGEYLKLIIFSRRMAIRSGRQNTVAIPICLSVL